LRRAAGLSGVPRDAFSGDPLRLTGDAGGPIIYSVGDDGRDDHGLQDAALGRRPAGDYLFRLSKLKPVTP
jgi:hypothetical protein